MQQTVFCPVGASVPLSALAPGHTGGLNELVRLVFDAKLMLAQVPEMSQTRLF